MTPTERAWTADLLGELRARVDDLDATVDDRRRRLETAQTERAELRRLLAAAIRRVPELPSAASFADAPPSPTSSPE
jgi:hypothetical protein